MDVQQLWQALAARERHHASRGHRHRHRPCAGAGPGALQSVDALRNALLSANGRTFRLGDVAEVRRGYAG